MKSLTDQQLLRNYARHRSEAAFAEIVRRHVDLVYSAALRMVRDAHLAEDVTQGTFVALARNASELVDRPVLSGWLHRTAQNLAANAVRAEVRHRTREKEAAAMNELLSPDTDATWEQIASHLDAALGELSDPDRDALLLRYFEHKTAGEMARILGVSDEAAQRRVSRAVERLREFFSKRNATIGASGLAVLISTNAVQSAPGGLVATISSAALTGAAVSTSTAVAATKTIATTALPKTIIGAAFAVVVGMGIYETLQATQQRKQIQTLQQQQAPLIEQLRQLRRARDDATNRLAAAIVKNEQLKANRSESELLRLRSEVTRLGTAQAQNENDSTASAAKAWLDRVNRLKDYLKQHPEKAIPEFQFLSVQRWLNAVEASGPQSEEVTNLDEYYHGPISFLRSLAESDFGVRIEIALQKYAAASKGQFPTDLSQLQPYCDPRVEALAQQLYEIKPASILPADRVKAMDIKTDWVVVRKKSAAPDSASRMAFWADGNISWTPTPSSKNH